MINPTNEQWLEGISNEDVLSGLRHPYSVEHIYDGEAGKWVPIARYTKNFRRIGELMMVAARPYAEHNGFVNKVMAVRHVKPGKVIRYDKDKDSTSYIVGEDHNVGSRSEGRYVYPLEVEYSVYPCIKAGDFLKDPKLMGEELARIQLKACNAIQFQQDRDLIALLTRAGEDNQKVQANSVEILDSLIHEIESRKLSYESILLNCEDAEFLRKNKDKLPALDLYHSNLMSGLIEAGCFGTYRGVTLYTQSKNMVEALGTKVDCDCETKVASVECCMSKDMIPKGTMIAVAPKEYIGGAPVRVDWMSEPMREEREGKIVYGWFWFKLMSMLVINPKAVAIGEIKY